MKRITEKILIFLLVLNLVFLPATAYAMVVEDIINVNKPKVKNIISWVISGGMLYHMYKVKETTDEMTEALYERTKGWDEYLEAKMESTWNNLRYSKGMETRVQKNVYKNKAFFSRALNPDRDVRLDFPALTDAEYEEIENDYINYVRNAKFIPSPMLKKYADMWDMEGSDIQYSSNDNQLYDRPFSDADIYKDDEGFINFWGPVIRLGMNLPTMLKVSLIVVFQLLHALAFHLQYMDIGEFFYCEYYFPIQDRTFTIYISSSDGYSLNDMDVFMYEKGSNFRYNLIENNKPWKNGCYFDFLKNFDMPGVNPAFPHTWEGFLNAYSYENFATTTYFPRDFVVDAPVVNVPDSVVDGSFELNPDVVLEDVETVKVKYADGAFVSDSSQAGAGTGAETGTGEIDMTLPASISINFQPLIDCMQGVTKKFPFSIPWDIASMLDILAVDRKDPIFHLEYTLAGAKIEYDIDFRSYGFGNLFLFARYIILFFFVLWLMINTKKLIKL